MNTRQPPPTSKMHTPPLPPSFTPRSSSSVSTETPRRRNNETIATPRSMTIAQSPKLQAFYEHIMSPMETSPGSDPRFRRRGRQPTACTECNRRKQRCDGMMPCHHCSKRNVQELCRFPDSKPKIEEALDTSSLSGSGSGSGSSGRGSGSDISFSRKSNRSQSPHRCTSIYSPERYHSSPVAMTSPCSGSDISASTLAPRTGYTPARRPSLQDLVTVTAAHSIPVSSERTAAPWREERFRGTLTPDSWGSTHEDGVVMQEGGALGYGSLAAEDGREFQFYGTSHFGPRAAAQFFQQMNGSRKDSLSVRDAQYPPSGGDLGPDTLASHIRQLDGRLPHRSLCEQYVDSFFALANSWMDILYEEDFRAKYATFWRIKGEFEDMTRIDVRWLALLHVVLAFGALLDRGPNRAADPESLSYRFFVGARRALSEAPSFGGESIDTVRAYALLSHYLVMTRRVPEAWNMLGNAVRTSEAQGFHVDGEKWKDLGPKDAELRRRLWAQMYCLDRSISYFLGRPLAIHDDKFSVLPPNNMTDDELNVIPRVDWPLNLPTKSTFLILHYRLAHIIGRILTTCFGLSPRKHSEVMECEYAMVAWMKALPPVFNFDDPDLSWDTRHPWLRLQRQTLMSKFHQARISLHRPYLLHAGYQESRLACVLSAGAELRHRLGLLENDADALDRFKWMTVASGFAPASILGLLLARNKREENVYDYDEIRSLFAAYLAAERRSCRGDRVPDTEMKVLDMMLTKADEVDRARREEESYPSVRSPARNGPLSVSELTLPSPTVLVPQVPYIGVGVTLAPAAEDWLHFPGCGRPWEPRPPCDPSAAAFPAADDMQSWAGLLNFIGTPAEAQPWYDSSGVMDAGE